MTEIHTPRRRHARRGGWVPRALVVATALVACGVGVRVLTTQQSSAAAVWQPVGMSIAAAEDTAHAQQVGTLAPGVVGANTFVLALEQPQTYGRPQQPEHISALTARATSASGAARDLVLHPNAGRTAWSAPIDLPGTGKWTFAVRIERPRQAAESLSLVENVVSAKPGKQEIIGIPADLTGARSTLCRNQALGAQVAMADVDATAKPHTTKTRFDVVDLSAGADAALARLTQLGARAIALPCGDDAAVAAVARAAHDRGLPVVLGAAPAQATGPGVWSTLPDWTREGAAIGAQTRTQAVGAVDVVTGPSATDAAELAGLRQSLSGSGLAVHYEGVPADPAAWVAQAAHYNVAVLLLGPAEVKPVLQALSGVVTKTGSRGLPGRGVLASSQLMDADVIDSAWPITKIGIVEFASDIDPFDPIVQYYIQRLQISAPTVRPTFDGIRGYDAALALAEAIRVAGGSRGKVPAGPQIASVIGAHMGAFTIGSYGVNWSANGGHSNRVAFFRTTYLNPMAMPYETPVGDNMDAAHMGGLLGMGGFEQVAPFRTLS
jgi:hypothetical protein